jgi:hypothetical protein
MSFFESEFVAEMIQTHFGQLKKLEDEEIKNLQATYKRIRQDLRDRLEVVQGDTFTAQQLRIVLVQIETALDAMKSGMLSDMGESAQKAAILGSENLIREVESFENEFVGTVTPINIRPALIASDTSNFLFNQYQASLDAYSEGLRSSMTRSLSQAAIERVSLSELTRRIGQFFIGEEWKILRIARTELSNIYNLSKLNTLSEASTQVSGLKKTLFHPMDDRTGQDSKQAEAKELVVDVDKPFTYTFTRTLADGTVKRETRRFMSPPDRPNDRSVMIPYHADWDQ